MTSATSAAPPSMDRAYERANPVCVRLSLEEIAPVIEARPFTAPSTHRLSKKTSDLVAY